MSGKQRKPKSNFITQLKHSTFLIPAVILLAGFFLVPIIMTFYYSFTNLALSGANAKNFQVVGLDGTINQFLAAVGLPTIKWLQKMPMLTIVLANVWHGTAFSMMNFQSALDGVSADIEEAATMDGANYFQTLFHIIIPCIRSTIATNTMLNTLSTLGVFGLVYMMTGGGPGTKTTTIPIYMYKQAFVSQQLGYGTAIAMLLLVIGIILSVLYARIDKD